MIRFAPLACSALALAACSAHAAARSYPVAGFERIDMQGSADVHVRTGAAPSARAEGDARAIDRLVVEAHGGVLHIGTKPGMDWNWTRGTTRLVVTVTVPRLVGATMHGSGDFTVDRVAAPAFDLALTGSGNARIGAVEAGRVGLGLTGSGDIAATGRAQTVQIDAGGSGSVRAAPLHAESARVTLTGSGDVALTAQRSADVHLNGSGDVTIAGGAHCTVEKHGSGSVRCGGS